MVAYVYDQRDRGIRFSSDGNRDLLTLYDASNKGDYGDSKVSAGYVMTAQVVFQLLFITTNLGAPTQ